MKKSIMFFVFVLISRIAMASVVDAPHNEISCSTCHSYSLWWQYSPASQNPGPNDHASIVESVCMDCHDGSRDIPAVTTHSSTVINSTVHGVWGVGCTSCHNPHYQDQLDWVGSATEPYLVTGTILGLTYDSILNQSTIAYGGATENQHWPQVGVLSTDPDWANKSVVNPDRGLILVHDRQKALSTFSIISATPVEVVIKGELDPNAVNPDYVNPQTQIRNTTTCNTFGLIYGQFIKKTIAGKDVKFFDPAGGFVGDGTSATGICQVCHTDTTHFTNSGVLPTGSDSHKGRERGNCITCHKHNEGFKGNGHDNTSFVWAGNCRTCHDPDNAIQNIATEIHSRSCGLCHVEPGGGGPQKDGEALNGVDGSALGATNASSCVDCHLNALSLTADVIHHQSAHGYADAGNCTFCHQDTLAIHDHRVVVPRCADCHETGAQAEIDMLHSQCNTCHQYSGTKLTLSVVANAIATGKGASGIDINCLACHIGSNFDTQQLVGIIHHKTTSAQNNECESCHTAVNHSPMVATTPACTATCHAGTAGMGIGVPVSLTDGAIHDSCRTCHIFGGAFRGRLVNFTNQKGVNGTGTLPEAGTVGGTDGGGSCAVCHTASADLGLLHHTSFSFTTEAACSSCHSGLDTVVNVHGNKCSLCHVDPDSGNMTRRTGVDGDARNADTVTTASCTVCHEPTTFPTGGIHHDTVTAANNDCATTCHVAVDHSITVAASTDCVSCHKNTAGTATGLAVSLTDAAIHDACRTCHAFDAQKRGILKGFTNSKGVVGTGTLPDGGGFCESCHTIEPISAYHHTVARTAVGQCETCHVDPRPEWGPNKPGDNVNGVINTGVSLPRPTQMACKKCHVKFEGGNMIVTRFERPNSDYSTYRNNWNKTTAHTIPMTAGGTMGAGTRINNYGICLSCHDGVKATQVGLWHAHPSRFGGSSWTFSAEGFGKTNHRGSGSAAMTVNEGGPGDTAHYIPGRSKHLATDIAPQSGIAGFNIFTPNYGGFPGYINTNYRSNAPGMDYDAFQYPAWDTPTFVRISVPETAKLGVPPSVTLNNTTRSVPVFASLTPVASLPSVTNSVKVKSAIYDSTTSTLTVVASTSSVCANLRTVYDSGETIMTGSPTNCIATIANPNYPANGTTVDVTIKNVLGLDVIGYRITAPNPGVLAFSSASYSVAETGTVAIVVSRMGGSTGSVSVDYATSNGSATAGTGTGADYTAATGTLTFDNGVTEKTILITIRPDSTPEYHETVNLTLSNSTNGAILGRPDTAVLTIVDDDFVAGTVALAAASYTVNETAGTVAITVNRTGSAVGVVSVDYSTNSFGSTAKAGSNYTPTAGTLTWANGESGSRTFFIPILVDPIVIKNTKLNLYIHNPTGGVNLGAQITAVVNIITPAVAVVNDWPATPQLKGTTGNPLGSPNNNFIIGAGSNRLLLVAVSCLSNNISDFGQNFSATYGGRLLTQAARQNSINRQTWIGYLKEADIVLRSDNVVNVTVDGVHTEVVAFIASYQNVNQANPVATSGGNSWPILNYDGGYRTAVNTTPLQVGPGGYAIYNWSSVLLTRISDSENYTENADYLHSSGIASKPFPSAANTNPTVSWSYYATGGGTDRSGSSSGITLNSYAGTVAFAMSTSTYSVKENVGEATITVQRLGSASGAVSVHYAASSGIYWTLAGIDFTPVSGDLSWGDGEMTPKTFTVPIMDNQLANYDKLVNVTLTDPTGAILGVPNTAVLTIVNDESTIAFTASTYSVNENGGEVVITASRANSATEAVSVNYATIAGGTAIPGTEYLPVSGTLNWAPGDVANKTFSIVINDNTEYQGDKTIYLALTNPTGGALLGTSNMAVLTIAEDESGVCFSAGTYTIKEDGGAATITVNRHGTSTGPVSVDYLATGDTAAAGIDFGPVSGALSWAAGDLSAKNFIVPIVDDTEPEDNKSVTLTLSNPTGGAFFCSSASSVLNIIDNDHPGTIALTSSAYSIDEDSLTGWVYITAQRTGGSDGAVTVNYESSSSTAVDYEINWYDTYWDYHLHPSSGTISWADGDMADKKLLVEVNRDSQWEGNETVNISLTSLTGLATLGSPNSTVLTIVDGDDFPGNLALAAMTYSVGEDAGTAVVTVTRANGYNGAVRVHYATSGGTAIANTDYSHVAGNLNWADGDTSAKSITIPILNNSVQSADRTVGIVLSSPTGGATLDGSLKTAVLTIVDDEAKAGTIALTAATYSVNENIGTVAITAVRSGGSTGSVSVSCATNGGTATAGSDFIAASGNLVWANGQTGSQTFSITILEDEEVEGNETVIFSLSNPTGGAALGGATDGVLTIEAPGVAVLDGWPAVPQISGSSSTVNGDFSISAGSNRLLLVAISCINQDVQTFSVTYGGKPLTQATMQLSSSATWLGYLTEDEISSRNGDVVQVSVDGRYQTLAASMASYSNVDQTNPIAAAGGTLRPRYAWLSYYSKPWAITPFPLGVGTGGYGIYTWTDTANSSFASTRISDNENYTENMNFALPGIKGGVASKAFSELATTKPAITWDAPPYATHSIITLNKFTETEGVSSPLPSLLTLRASSYRVVENAGSITVTVSRAGSSQGAVSVDYATLDNGTATSGLDYVTTSGTLHWDDGDMSDKAFSVSVVDNTLYNLDKTLSLLLSSPAGHLATLGNSSTALLTIVDDELEPATIIAFPSASYSVNENAGTATITVSRTGGASKSVSVNYATSGGDAQVGTQYTATSGTLVWGIGDMTDKTFTVSIIDNLAYSSLNRRVWIQLTNPAGGAIIGTQYWTWLTIVEDEVPALIALDSSTYSVNENGGVATITAKRTGNSTGPVGVYYEANGGSAVLFSDYGLTMGWLNWADGDMADKTFVIPIVDNNVHSVNKTVNAILYFATGIAAIGTPASATVTIVNDDLYLDDDEDLVQNAVDLCPNTPVGQAVDADGCALLQLDSDHDGVVDPLDLCPGTPAGQPVAADGCADTDQDTVADTQDLCPNTPAGQAVNSNGCALSQLDTDNDTVNDDLDLCSATPTGQSVDVNGCALSQLDTDHDGVSDALDQCPFTASGATVDASGCSVDQQSYQFPDSGQTTSYTNTFGEDHDYPLNPLSYVVEGATVVDQNTGLIWQQQDDNTKRNWDAAISYCSDLTLGNQSDWRLPSRQELITILDMGRQQPAINPTFTSTKSDRYWTGVSGALSSTSAWTVSFTNLVNPLFPLQKTGANYVRCVRGGR
ncbi:MAG: DUF1566 domain-containing protein [Proteobacteria bacterium]|nr:DUF1566 domain-containing protein [Pseudomonadota bacterium]